MIVLSGENECYTTASGSVTANYDVKSNQEEANTKVVIYATQIIQCTPFKVMIRNPSGDTGIMILILSLIADQDKVYIDCGSGRRRKEI